MLAKSYMALQEDGLVDMQATSDKINSVSVFCYLKIMISIGEK